MRQCSPRVLAVLTAALCLTGIVTAQVEIDSNTFGGLHARSIGPAVMSGRIAAIDAVAEDPLTIYADAATGGVWKSKDGGITWKPVFDDHPQSIGAIEIDPNDPNTVWVGTGETWARNSVSVGAGVYKTTDGSDSWALVGLEATERVARIAIDGDDGNTVYVCATGQLWRANEERGVFKTTDSGESWEKISPDLTTNDPQRQRHKQSGGLTIDNSTAENNTTIYTISESPLDGKVIWVGTDDGLVQVTRDGGGSWTNVTDNIPDLPSGLWVSHVEASPHEKGTAHLTVDGHRSGDMNTYVYRTTDFGQSWESIVGEGLASFAHVVVQDLVNPDLLFAGTETGRYITPSADDLWEGLFPSGRSQGASLRGNFTMLKRR